VRGARCEVRGAIKRKCKCKCKCKCREEKVLRRLFRLLSFCRPFASRDRPAFRNSRPSCEVLLGLLGLLRLRRLLRRLRLLRSPTSTRSTRSGAGLRKQSSPAGSYLYSRTTPKTQPQVTHYTQHCTDVPPATNRHKHGHSSVGKETWRVHKATRDLLSFCLSC